MTGARCRSHLFLALGRGGMGEVRLGVEIARGLTAFGDRVTILVHPVFSGLFRGLGLDVRETVPDPTPAEKLWTTPAHPSRQERQIRAVADEIRPVSVGLVDYVQCFEGLLRTDCSPALPSSLAGPFWMLDTWSFSEFPTPAPGEPLILDISDGERVRIDPRAATYPRRLVPVPFARPEVPGGFRVLPAPIRLPDPARREVRRGLGLGADDRLLLFCTAGWQHREYLGRNAAAARSVPALLALHLARLPRQVHLVHLGPHPFPAIAAALGDRHHHLPPQPVAAFERLLAAADALLSLNASATTQISAAAADVPVVCLVNDDEGPADGLEGRLGHPLDPELRAWARAHLPLPAFRMWPLSMARALRPVLADNPWAGLLGLTPVLDAPAVHGALVRTLFDPGTRARLGEERARYVASVGALPTGAARVHALGGAP